MKKNQHQFQQIVKILEQAISGTPVKEVCRQSGLLAGKVSALGFRHRISIVQKRLPRILHCLTGILFLPVNAAIADDCDFGSPDFFESATVASIEDCIQSGQDVNSKGFQGTTALHWTARLNTNPAVIAALLKAGADINSRDEIFNRTPLYDAVSFNSEPAVISVLLEAGADVNDQDERGVTPLHLAAQNNTEPAVISVLLEAGADISSQDNSGETPLHAAAYNNSEPAVISALLEAGADINSRSEHGETPLHRAAYNNSEPAIISVLLEAGADINSRNEFGDTPLDQAIIYNNEPAATALIKAGADSNNTEDGKKATQDHTQETSDLINPDKRREPLSHNCDIGSADFFESATAAITEDCIQSGQNPNSPDKDSRTPLHWAAAKTTEPAVIVALIEAGADISSPDEYGETPLHWAATFNTEPIIVSVLNRGWRRHQQSG